MTTSSSAIDTGPLSWVIGEIREALAKSASALSAALTQDADAQATSLRQAKSFLHQAHGALQMVDVDGVTLITGTAEDVLDRVINNKLALTPEVTSAADHAYQALTEYLEELLSGTPPQALRLFPYYRALLEARGDKRANPADLYFPNLSHHPKLPIETNAQASVADYGNLRQRFERALLPFLKDMERNAELAHTIVMRNLIGDVEKMQTEPQSRAFWWVLHGFAEAVAARQIPNDLDVKQVFARINLHIRKLSQGAAGIVEDLLRDALFFIAQIKEPSPRAQQIRAAYRLEASVPPDYETRRYGQIDIQALVVTKERLAQAKTMWNRIAGGDASVADSFASEMLGLVAAGAKLNVAPLTKLLRELSGIARHAAHGQQGDRVGLELATGLLFVENALNNIGHLPDNFAEHADALAARLLSVVAGETPAESGQWLDDMSREAQQRQTLTVLGQEMQANLRQVEKMLDEYFRDPSHNASLTQIDATLHQLQGAIAILELDDAVAAVQRTREDVQHFAMLEAGTAPDAEASRKIAQNVGALSFFIEALQHDFDGATRRYAFDKERGVFQAKLLEKPAEETEAHSLIDMPVMEAHAVKQEQQPAAEPSLPDIPELNAPETPEQHEANPQDTLPDMFAAREPEPVAPTPPSLPAVAVPESEEAIDAELLEIFLSEAVEVLERIRETIPESRKAPHDQEHLTTLRRSFHTLKGSSRMVGLTAFGEGAWSIEQVLNLRLSESRDGDADLYALMEKAEEVLGAWVEDLRVRGKSSRTPDALVAAADRMKNGGAFHFEELVPTNESSEQMVSTAPAEELPSPLPAAEEVELSDADLAMFQPHAQTPEPVAEEPAFGSVGSDDGIKRIGNIEISVPLYNIYLAETDELVRRLAQDMGEWRHEPERIVNIESVHAAHSLAGSSATVGFKPLQEVAYAFEMVLQLLARTPVTLQAYEFDMLEHSAALLKRMLQDFALGDMPAHEPEAVGLLNSLKESLQARASDAASAAASQSMLSMPAEPSSSAAPVEGLTANLKDEIDPDLLPVFLEEGRDMLPHMGQALRVWQEQPANTGLPQSLLRVLHTLKGSARMAGAMNFGQHLHDMETRIENLMHIGTPSSVAIDDLLVRYDQSLYMFEALQRPVVEPMPTGERRRSTDVPQAATDNEAPQQTVVVQPLMPTPQRRASDTPAPAVPAAAATLTASPLVRVRADLLDRLVNQAGEVSISRSRLETGVGTLRQSLSELTENVARLRDQLREIEMQAESQISSRMSQSSDREFDPLEFDRFTRLQELTRMMAESVADVGTVQHTLNRTLENAVGDLSVQARLTRDLQQDLMRVRMVQFGSISERLFRVTRQAAKELDKRVNLDIRGAMVELDRGVLEKMTGPFEHLLRNAIVHGIESREARRAAGKEETGELLVEVRQEGNEVVIQFSDDGRGLNLDSIRSKAKSVGLLTDDSKLSDDEVRDLIFQPGFSTADEITELAGRGVGMDVVRSEAAALGGRVATRSVDGKGAQFTIHLPLTLAVTQVVLLSSGGKTYALPSVLVEQVQQLKANPLAAAYNDGAIMWQDQRVPMFYLPALLGDTAASPVAQQYSPLMILKSGNDRVALHVDEIIGNREVVVKNIGPQLARMIGIAGATVLGSGEIVLILNPVPLAQRAAHENIRAPRILGADDKHASSDMGAVVELAQVSSPSQSDVAHFAPVAPIQGLRMQHIVMVVDDSLTVRRVTQRLLSREGYQVVLAKDGVDALQHLQSITPDVMLVDIEMPRMDGFDLTRNVRSDARTHEVPIIMITSRTAEKHRKYAMELGVNEYLGKPYREDELLRLIAGFVGKPVPVT
jgi:chemosensory pili system protein ChpA (sensor histidine kinase/response regulator)